MSWQPQAMTFYAPKWTDNDLRFATKQEAEAMLKDLTSRWPWFVDYRVVKRKDPITHRWVGKLETID